MAVQLMAHSEYSGAPLLRNIAYVEAISWVPFTIGLFSSVHCVGMCGGIIGALSMSLPAPVRERRWLLMTYLLAYSLGRIVSYALAGAIIGVVGQQLFAFISPQYGHRIVQWFAATLLIGIGLYLAGWFPRFAVVERIGVPLWQRLEPLGRHLLPVRSPLHAFAFGLIWGWLPCGLVYSTLLWTASAGTAGQGAIYMVLFGLGTLPAVLAAGLLAGWLTRFARQVRVRQAVGLLLVAMALGTLWYQGQSGTHAGHQHAHQP